MNDLASKEFLIGKALLTNGKSAGVPRDDIIKIQQILKLFSRKCQIKISCVVDICICLDMRENIGSM